MIQREPKRVAILHKQGYCLLARFTVIINLKSSRSFPSLSPSLLYTYTWHWPHDHRLELSSVDPLKHGGIYMYQLLLY